MLNLLLISNNKKCEVIRDYLQPLLKVKIDVVADFDHGLKDVFEKRPATICIQEQISGVTGESVAKHIQMLLGNSAPLFILMHDGNSRLKPVKGLFEHILDLSLPEKELLVSFKSTLKSILGPQWDKLYIPPKEEQQPVTKPAGNPEIASKLVDDFLSDLEATPDLSVTDETPVHPHLVEFSELSGVEPIFSVTSNTDELASLLTESVIKEKEIEKNSKSPTDDLRTAVKPSTVQQPASSSPLRPLENAEKVALEVSRESALHPLPPSQPKVEIAKPPEASRTATSVTTSETQLKPLVSTAVQAAKTPEPALPQPPENKPPVPVKEDFSIVSKNTVNTGTVTQESIPDDLLLAFEENYHSRDSFWKNPVVYGLLVLILVLAAALYQFRGYLPFLNNKQPKTAVTASPSTSDKSDKTAKATPVPPSQQSAVPEKQAAPAAAVKQPASATPPKLPSFIPSAGFDKDYGTDKPGWERYRGAEREFRIYRIDGKIRALQVLANKGKSISEDSLRTMLTEVAGNPKINSTQKEEKQGFILQRGTAGANTDILMYRHKKSGVIRAFVVSFN